MRDEQVIHGLRKLARMMYSYITNGCSGYDPVDFDRCCRCEFADHEALSCRLLDDIRKAMDELSVY